MKREGKERIEAFRAMHAEIPAKRTGPCAFFKEVSVFTSIYIYRVPCENVEAFLQVQREAADIYRRYGALDDETFAPVNLEAKYGCVAFPGALDVGPGEEVFVSLSRFRDRAHHDQVMVQIDADDRISELYRQVTTLLDVSRVVRGEFKRIV
jgi:uncharacterized protein YbaA (DUF1428 family)